MRTVAIAVLVVWACAGCADHRPFDRRGADPGIGPDPSLLHENVGAQLVIPATGGPAVLATPIGGDVYQPVTGGPTITATPTSLDPE